MIYTYTKKNPLILLFFLFLLFSLFLCLGCGDSGIKKTSPHAENGILDLRNWSFEKDGIVSLNGQWEFSWQSLIEPVVFNSGKTQTPTGYYEFPGIWNRGDINGGNYPSGGYATFVLTILHEMPDAKLSLEIMDMASAYTLYVDGQKISSNGVVGKTRESMTPEFKPAIVHFSPFASPIKIVLHISNFHHRKGGPWSVIKLGSVKQIQDKQARSFFLNSFFNRQYFHHGNVSSRVIYYQ